MLDPLFHFDAWTDPAVWRAIGDVVGVLGVALFAPRPNAERNVHDRERQSGDLLHVAAMTRGDRAGLAALYDRYAGILLGLGVRILGDRREAEDVVHDVFLEVWSAAAAYDPARGSVSTWLVMRMRSRSLDRVRSAGRSRTLLADDPTEHAPPPPVPADTQRAADVVAMQRALAALPLEQRRVLELGYFGGLSSSEIAAEIGVSIGTVKSRTAAGLSKLRTRLGGGA